MLAAVSTIKGLDEGISTQLIHIYSPYLWALDGLTLAGIARGRIDGELQGGHGSGSSSTRRVPYECSKSDEPGDGTCSGGPR